MHLQRLAVCSVVALFAAHLCYAGGATPSKHPWVYRHPALPRPYAYPALPQYKIPAKPPDNDPNHIYITFSFTGLKGWPPFDLMLGHSERVQQVVDLDRWGRQWTFYFLQLKAGTDEPWNPDYRFTVAPGDGPGQLNVRTGEVIWRFAVDPAKIPPGGVRALNAQTTILQELNGFLVVTDTFIGKGEQFWFEWSQAAGNWRLARICDKRRPGSITRIEYEGDRMTAVLYPDGISRTRLRWEDGWVCALDLPSGDRVRLDRDASHFVSGVTFLQPAPSAITAAVDWSGDSWEGEPGVYERLHTSWPLSLRSAPPRVYRRCVYEHQPDGTLTGSVDWYGNALTFDYEKRRDADGLEHDTILVTNETDGGYWQQSLDEQQDGNWRYHHGRGSQGQELATVKMHNGPLLVCAASSQVLVLPGDDAPAKPLPPPPPPPQPDPSTFPFPPEIKELARTARLDVQSEGSYVEGYDACDRTVFRWYRGTYYWTFAYTSGGDLLRVTTLFGLAFGSDSLGRLTDMTEGPDLSRTDWRYDNRNRLAVTREVPIRNGKIRLARGFDEDADGPLYTRCEYTAWGWPRLIHHRDGTWERFLWHADRLVAWRAPDGVIHYYTYGPHGDLLQARDSTGKVTTFDSPEFVNQPLLR